MDDVEKELALLVAAFLAAAVLEEAVVGVMVAGRSRSRSQSWL
jgi:hypothetical protein